MTTIAPAGPFIGRRASAAGRPAAPPQSRPTPALEAVWELGRSCVDPGGRSGGVILTLWVTN